MARIRTIKPAFWDDEKLSKLSFLSRLTYIGMWTFSDDYGVVKGNPDWLKNNIFPYNDFEMPGFDKSLQELIDLKRIFKFKDNSETYFYMPYFVEHQKIDRLSKMTKNPNPPTEFTDGS